MTVTDFRHAAPAFRIFSGSRALGHLPKELSRLGVGRVLLVTVPPMRQHPSFAGVEAALGEQLVGVFDGVEEHSPLPGVERAVTSLERTGADAVIAVGGGSTIVTARAAVILAAEGKPITQLCTSRAEDGSLLSPRLSAPKMPQWIVPSSPTTAYARVGAAVREPRTGERLALYDPKVRAQGVFFDPGVAGSAPAGMVRSSALTAWSMAVEGLQNLRIDPIAESMLVHTVHLVRDALARFAADDADEQARLSLMTAAALSGQGSEFTGGGLATGLSHALGQVAAVPNGVVEAIMLPHCVRFNVPVTASRLAVVAGHLGLSGATTQTAGDQVADLCTGLLRTLGVPVRLRDVGLAREHVSDVVDLAENDWFLSAVPRTASRADLEELLHQAW